MIAFKIFFYLLGLGGLDSDEDSDAGGLEGVGQPSNDWIGTGNDDG